MSVQTASNREGVRGRPGRRRWRVRLAIAFAAALVVVLVVSGAVVYAAFLRKPINHPAAFLARGRAPATRTVVVNAGSSTTHASLSSDYVAMLRERFGDSYEFVNAGVNGATSASLLDGLDEIIACRPDAVSVLIGGNDVRDGVPADVFHANMDAILRRLRAETGARIAMFSITPYGERLDSAANRAQAPYNAALEDLATAHEVTYLPLNETMGAILQRRPSASEPQPPPGPQIDAAVRRFVGRRSWDEIAAANGLRLLTDHIHLSDQGATVVADLATHWLAQDGVEISDAPPPPGERRTT